MSEMSHDSFQSNIPLPYDKMTHMAEKEDEEARLKSYNNVGGYNVPYHLKGLVSEFGISPDKVCAIEDLFESVEDFRQAFLLTETHDRDSGFYEAEIRWAQLDLNTR